LADVCLVSFPLICAPCACALRSAPASPFPPSSYLSECAGAPLLSSCGDGSQAQPAPLLFFPSFRPEETTPTFLFLRTICRSGRCSSSFSLGNDRACLFLSLQDDRTVGGACPPPPYFLETSSLDDGVSSSFSLRPCRSDERGAAAAPSSPSSRRGALPPISAAFFFPSPLPDCDNRSTSPFFFQIGPLGRHRTPTFPPLLPFLRQPSASSRNPVVILPKTYIEKVSRARVPSPSPPRKGGLFRRGDE